MPSASRLELEKLCSDHYHDLTAQMVLFLTNESELDLSVKSSIAPDRIMMRYEARTLKCLKH